MSPSHDGHPHPTGQKSPDAPPFALIPAAYVLLRRHDDHGRRQVLLQRREGTGFMDGLWACGAAGHVEAGESVVDAAVREADEELGITLDPADLVVLTVAHRRHEDALPVNQRVDFYFAADVWTGTPHRREKHKSGDLRWFDLADLPADIVPHERRVLSGLAAGDLPHLLTTGFTEG